MGNATRGGLRESPTDGKAVYNSPMPALITLSCPSCGAQMRVPAGAEQYQCDYCGNTHVLPPQLRTRPQPLRPLVSTPESVRIETDEHGGVSSSVGFR